MNPRQQRPDASVSSTSRIQNTNSSTEAFEPESSLPKPLREHARMLADDLRAAQRTATDSATPQRGVNSRLRASVIEAALDAMVDAANDERHTLESSLADRLDVSQSHADDETPEASVTLDVAVEETFAAGYMRRQLRQHVAVLDAVVLGQDVATDRPVTEIAHWLMRAASRYGSQALAETLSFVESKRWIPSGDCPVHGMLDERTIPVEDSFVVDDRDAYPRTMYVAGEDAVLGCDCRQQSVLGSTPTTPRELASLPGVVVRIDGSRVSPLTEREREVRHEHARPGETFEDLLGRVHAEQSVTGGARELGVTKKTLYRWLDKYRPDFDGYSGR